MEDKEDTDRHNSLEDNMRHAHNRQKMVFSFIVNGSCSMTLQAFDLAIS
jgi:hypothetical protein